jgi:hypothetical protein
MILPLTLGFLLQFQSASLEPMITAREYFGFATSMSLALGAVFELPILILALTALGLVTPALLNRFRRHAVVRASSARRSSRPGATAVDDGARRAAVPAVRAERGAVGGRLPRRRAREAARVAEEEAEAAAEAARVAARVDTLEAERVPRRLDEAAAQAPLDQQGVA